LKTEDILNAIDEEINRLTRIKALLRGAEAPQKERKKRTMSAGRPLPGVRS
jgi:hypothetical protein